MQYGKKFKWKWTKGGHTHNKFQFNSRQPIPVFDDKTRQTLYTDERTGFVCTVLRGFNPRTTTPDDIVQEARRYFQNRYHVHRRNRRQRSSHWLNSASSALSELKRVLAQTFMATYRYRKQLRISKRELLYLDKFNHTRLEHKTNYLKEINLTDLLIKLYQLLMSSEPAEIALGVAGLTGRRQTEVVFSANFAPPQNPTYHRYRSFWAYVTGFSKTNRYDKYAVRARELPLLAPRQSIQDALVDLRSMWPSDSHRQASGLYAKMLTKAVRQHLRPLGIIRMHDLRKTFVQMAFPLFNERDSVVPAFASKVLGHKSTLSHRIMTYLVTRTSTPPNIDLVFSLANRNELHSSQPEYQDFI